MALLLGAPEHGGCGVSCEHQGIANLVHSHYISPYSYMYIKIVFNEHNRECKIHETCICVMYG